MFPIFYTCGVNPLNIELLNLKQVHRKLRNSRGASVVQCQSARLSSLISILSENVLNVTGIQCSTNVKSCSQYSAKSHGVFPGAPVSSHREVDRVG